MLVDLNNPESLFIILIQNAFYAGRFSRSGIPEQQTVIRPPSLHKSLSIGNQLFFCNLVPNQIVQMDMGDIRNRHNLGAFLCMGNAECLMQPQFPYAKVFIKGLNIPLKLPDI